MTVEELITKLKKLDPNAVVMMVDHCGTNGWYCRADGCEQFIDEKEAKSNGLADGQTMVQII